MGYISLSRAVLEFAMSNVRASEAELRAAMRDPRYWQFGHPERASHVARVSEGWRRLVEDEASEGGDVNVRSYVRNVGGRAVTVAAHTRADPAGGEASASTQALGTSEETEPAVVLASARQADCLAQWVRDNAICRTLPRAARRSCWASANDRYSQCGRGAYVPPLVTGR